ncbi:hypothetical protein FGO68_gene17761 [Halteria grandinella]|uniref:Uncharacterized protein n=1 Tax=Halteria grandinella TaxID=5974 RepID=A0A8J8NEE2_HALGN|nr:hypothetical protein FGO68_gene17761 [Halteria grandinella]
MAKNLILRNPRENQISKTTLKSWFMALFQKRQKIPLLLDPSGFLRGSATLVAMAGTSGATDGMRSLLSQNATLGYLVSAFSNLTPQRGRILNTVTSTCLETPMILKQKLVLYLKTMSNAHPPKKQMTILCSINS